MHRTVAFGEGIYTVGGLNLHAKLRTVEFFYIKTEQLISIKRIQSVQCSVYTEISEHKLYCFSGVKHNHEAATQ